MTITTLDAQLLAALFIQMAAPSRLFVDSEPSLWHDGVVVNLHGQSILIIRKVVLLQRF